MSAHPVPWSWLSSWKCRACGDCCRNYTPILTVAEGMKFMRTFGEVVGSCIRGFYIKKSIAGRCLFQYAFSNMWLCGIQDMKPSACKLWPFKVYRSPKYGKADESIYNYMNKDYYVYVDTECRGIAYGKPSVEFMTKTVPEFIEISLGGGVSQCYSTNFGVSRTSKTNYPVITVH